MKFKEWLLFNEMPHQLMRSPAAINFPGLNKDMIKVVFDGIDFKLEKYMNLNAYRQFILKGFNAKMPLSHVFFVYDAKTHYNRIGPDNPDFPYLPENWHQHAQFMLGNQVVYSDGEKVQSQLNFPAIA